jgi:hypothetical protein
MSRSIAALAVQRIAEPEPAGTVVLAQGGPFVGVVCRAESGVLEVRGQGGAAIECDVLESVSATVFVVGDRLLVLLPQGSGGRGVVLGRVGAYAPQPMERELRIEAAESLTLRCGEASIDLRADGKVMIRGDDVLVRAKGTQRIRAGTVSIN